MGTKKKEDPMYNFFPYGTPYYMPPTTPTVDPLKIYKHLKKMEEVKERKREEEEKKKKDNAKKPVQITLLQAFILASFLSPFLAPLWAWIIKTSVVSIVGTIATIPK